MYFAFFAAKPSPSSFLPRIARTTPSFVSRNSAVPTVFPLAFLNSAFARSYAIAYETRPTKKIAAAKIIKRILLIIVFSFQS